MAGTSGAFFQMQGMDHDLICRHLQCPDPDRYITQDAVAHAAGLLGQPLPPGTESTTWFDLGRHHADPTDRP